MNKTEKLLAARKKLKEFQLHKSNHDQEVTPNPPNPHHESVVAFQQNNQAISDVNNHNNHNDVDNNSNMHTVHPQSYFNSNVSNDTVIMDNSRLTAPITHPNNNDVKISNAEATIDRNIVENIETITTDEKKTSLDLPDSQNEFPSQETETKVFEPVKFTNFSSVIDDSTSVTKKPIENGADFFNSAIITQHFSDEMSNVSTNLKSDNTTGKLPGATNSELEHENRSLLSRLEMEKNTIQQLQTQLDHSHNKISELENLLVQKSSEYNDALQHQISPLREQIQMHRQAAEILVAEKADLGAELSKYQKLSIQNTDEINKLHEKLQHTVARMTEMERDLIAVKTNAEDDKILNEKLTSDYQELEKQYIELKKVREEQELESAELRQDLTIKKAELSTLHQQIEEKANILSLAELKIQQLTSMPQQLQEMGNHQDEQASLKQQLSQLHENLKLMSAEKDEIGKHYENYVKQLNIKYEETVKELESARKKLSEFVEREESLIQRLSLVEQHYQREKQKVESLLPLQAQEENIKHLTKSMDSLVLEQENLQRTLHEKEAEVESMKAELQELRELRDQSVETSKLVTALESEQLGASRAVSQNQQLKLQLNEMHDAFVMLSNSKLNLTEQLQDERSVGRKLNAEYARLEADRDELKEELDRRAAVIEELERDKLHFAQMADQMQHYQVQSNQTRTLQQELQNALNTIEVLKNKNQLLREQIDKSVEIVDGKIDAADTKIDDKDNENTPDMNSAVPHAIEPKEECPESHPSQLNSHEYDTLIENHKKLELRFKEAMERVAELSDEKQRLEHLVLQLQGETETIGEYITLYQKQRAILQMKSQEKERTFNQLIEERNKQQAQLHQLKILVAELIKIEEHTGNNPGPQQHSLPETCQENEHPTDECKIAAEGIETQTSVEPAIVDIKNETTSKILDLLTEIKDCKDMCSTEPNFHHCLWCSGKLITV